MVRWIVSHCRMFVCGAALSPCYVSIITSCILPWLIGTKHFQDPKHVPESKTRPRIQKHFPESKTRPRIQVFWILGSILDSWMCFWFLGRVLDSWKCFWILVVGSVFFPYEPPSIPERSCSLKFCNTFQPNSDLLLTCSSLTFQTFLEFLSSHTVDVSLKEAVNQRIHTLLVSL